MFAQTLWTEFFVPKSLSIKKTMKPCPSNPKDLHIQILRRHFISWSGIWFYATKKLLKLTMKNSCLNCVFIYMYFFFSIDHSLIDPHSSYPGWFRANSMGGGPCMNCMKRADCSYMQTFNCVGGQCLYPPHCAKVNCIVLINVGNSWSKQISNMTCKHKLSESGLLNLIH